MKKFILLVVVGLALLPLFHSGLFDVHDPTSLVRFYTLHETVRAGQFPAAWTNLLNQGYGYPLFLYYAPVFSYLGVILKLFTPTYLLALKFSIGLMVGVAAIGMYRLMRQSVGSLSALISASAYTLLPYHAATLYVRGSYAEGMTWAILPWLLYFWGRPKRDNRSIVITSVVTALFFMSHNSLPFVFAPFLLIWIVMYSKGFSKQIIITSLLSTCLSLWFLLPVLFERGLVQIDRIASLTIYSDHFLSLGQLWHSPWGYGGSAPVGQVDGMSFMLGKFQIILASLALLLVAKARKWDKRILFFLSILLFYSFMTTSISAPIWSVFNGLSILQFPWRLLAFASFGLAVLAGYSVEFIPKKAQLIFALLSISGLIFFNIKFFRPERYVNYLDQDFINESELRTVAKNKIPEYLPTWMPAFPTSAADDGYTRTAISVSGTTHYQESAPLTISATYMPQWQLKVDGKIEPIYPSQYGTIVSRNFFDPGAHQFEITWNRTLIENIGLGISAISVAVMIGLLII